MPSCKILALPFLAQVKIIGALDFPDLIRFANCSSKCTDLVASANTKDLKSSFDIKENRVIITIWARYGDPREFKFVVNEINYDWEKGFKFKWNGLGGSQFFECPGMGRSLYYPQGPSDDEDSDYEDDVADADQHSEAGSDQVFDDDEVSEDGSIEDESKGSEHLSQDSGSDQDSENDENLEDDIENDDQRFDSGSDQESVGDCVSENGSIEDESEGSEHSTQEDFGLDNDSNDDEVTGEESVEEKVERSDHEVDNEGVDQHSDAEDNLIEDEAKGFEDGSDNDQDPDKDADGANEEFRNVPNYDVAHPDSQKYYCKVSSPTGQTIFEVADLLITHLLKLFKRFKVGHFSLRPTDGAKQLVDKHEKLRKCDDLGIVDYWRDFDHHRPLTKELLEWSIEAIESRVCSYFCDVIGEFMYEKGFKPEHVEIKHGHLVHQNAILDSETKRFIFYRHLPSSTYINTILKEWVSNEKMKNLKKIQWELSSTQFDQVTCLFQEEVMDGIPEFLVSNKEHKALGPELFENFGSDATDYACFFRRVDGKLAVVFVNLERFLYVFFSF